MKGLKKLLLAEQARLERIILVTKERLQTAPEGNLRLSKCQNYLQYYHCTDKKKKGTYIRKENMDFIQKLAQKSYDEQVLRLAQKRFSQIKRMMKDYDDDEITNLYYKEHIERQKLVQPVEPTWEQRVQEWKNREYKGKDFQEGTPVILTEKGERVRSKSEKIMADYFFRQGIEYKYECPIYLRGMGTVYPDFTFLSKKTGQEVYWEHNGKIDVPEYARKAIRKIQAYENNDIFPGERLILTYETAQTILNTSVIEKFVNKNLV